MPRVVLAAELVRLKVDVIVVATVRATLAVRQATSTIPIVMSATELLEFQSQDC